MTVEVGTYVRALVWDIDTEDSIEHFGVVTDVINHPSAWLVEIRTIEGTLVQALASRVTTIRTRTAAGINVWMDAVEASLSR